jgi:membrane associated rhomboid family serine protease
MVVGFFLQLILAWYTTASFGSSDYSAWIYFSKDHALIYPWTFLTYAFFHADIEHFIWNVLVLGYLYFSYREVFGNRNWIQTWVLGSVVGAVVFAIANHATYLIGASCALWAILGYTLVKEIQWRDRLWNWKRVGRVSLFFVLFVGQFYFSDEKVAISSHLASLIAGVVFSVIKQFVEMGLWKKLVNWISGSPKLTVERSNPRFKTDDEFNTERKLKEDYLNSILEKIARSGYDSLSSKERVFLENQSQK